MANGFEQLGEMIAGGGVNREGAYLEGLDLGSQINARRASTQNAMAQARLRVDEAEARESLAEAIGDPQLAAIIRSGGNPEQFTGAQSDRQIAGFRDTIANPETPFGTAQRSAMAIEGKVQKPFQFGPGGELAADVFADDPTIGVTPTGSAQINLDDARADRLGTQSLADEALARQRDASAGLSERRTQKPDRAFAVDGEPDSTIPLADQILPGGKGQTVIPADINPEEALGAESFLKGGINRAVDFFGGGTPYMDQAEASNLLSELSARTQIAMRADVPGGRPPLMVQQLLARYAEDPTQLFRGDVTARMNLQTTTESLRRSLKRIQDQLNSPTEKTPTRQGNLEEALFKIADTVADYEAILAGLERTEGPLDAGAVDGGDTGGWKTTASGVRYRVKQE